MFFNKRIHFLTCEEMSKLIDKLSYTHEFVFCEHVAGMPIKRKAYIEDRLVKFSVTTWTDEGKTEFTTRKDEEREDQRISGAEAFRIMSKYYRVPRIEEFLPEICQKRMLGGWSATPIMYANPLYKGKRQYAIGYDLNGAYAAALKRPIPDTTVAPKCGIIGENEVGFTVDENGVLKAIYSGCSRYVYPLIESPFIPFVDKWYQSKITAITKEERQKAKQVINLAVGMLQRHNPFIRATVITHCNDYINSLIDDNTIFANTDCIVSLVRRPDIEANLGIECGQWKIEHEGDFAYLSEGACQWYGDKVSYKGVSKNQIKDGFDILSDEIEARKIEWHFDYTKYKYVKKENNDD